MKRMSKWIAICAVCIMCSVPVMGADIAVNPKPTEIPVVEITPTETPTPIPVPKVKNGWYTFGSKKRYYKNDKYYVGMNKVSEDQSIYYFDKNGYMKKGWITYKNKKYYFGTDGKRCTGVQKIKGKYYYFSEKGVMKKGTVKLGKYTYYCTEKGILEAQKKGNTLYYADGKKMSSQKAYEYETLQRAKNVVSKITTSGMSKGKKFQTCFNWVIKHNYSTKRIFMNQTSWPALYANDYLVDSNTVGHGGNCFSDACAFAYLAKALGYKNVYVCVDTNKVGGSGHCWAEIGGLVYDPLFAEAKNYSKYFGATYRTYGLSAIRKVAI